METQVPLFDVLLRITLLVWQLIGEGQEISAASIRA
jgi:hypothetical protein